MAYVDGSLSTMQRSDKPSIRATGSYNVRVTIKDQNNTRRKTIGIARAGQGRVLA